MNAIVFDPSGFKLPENQRRPLLWAMYIGYAALTAGIFHGLAQSLSYAGIDILGYFPFLKSYYQGLTAHGVANALIFTFSFSNGFLPLMTARALSKKLVDWMLWLSFGLLALGNVLVIYAVAANKASVLYTSYAPLQAHWTYYIGLALVVVSTWVALANMIIVWRQWRKENPGERVPLLAHISVFSYSMWGLASIPIAVSFLGFLTPWTLGWMEKTDPLLTRTLFWFTAHAIVYAWLLPAYVSWYALVPRQAGGKIVSDSLTRFVFVLFLLLSIPTGFHHQYTDPGIATWMKAIHGVLTFGVFFPSLATAFSVMASLEIGGRAAGGRGLLGWIRKLPWKDPSLVAQLLAMITFVFGGITGLINASFTMNQVVHNTTWIPGHFHMTVGSAVALTLMGVAYWLVPYLSGRGLWGKTWAVASSWIYTIGVLIFARGMISAGLEGMPRRIYRAQATYTNEAWDLGGALTAVGGSLMFIGIFVFFIVILVTILWGKKGDIPADIPWSETLAAPGLSKWELRLDKLGFWMVVAIVMIIVAYGPFFASYLPPNFVSPGFTLW
ncbi:MAG: cytochrome C oxidase subunit I [Rhodothermales bacterium]|nr:cytochrome C oxidase subunit I [Rhodothermales bacterium]